MAHQIVECVPNFSEGRDMAKIKLITDAIEAVSGVTLLDVDPGADTNRTVVTFVGSPEAVKEGAFIAIKKASEVLDMSTHHGSHPRFGATDVCPFVPVEGVTMEDCAAIAHEVGERVGRELGIPIFFYEHAAKTPERRNLAVVRAGEYEALPERLTSSQWAPDEGPAEWNDHIKRTGATAMSAREFLIAYNVTLNSRDKDIANDIALDIREKGRVARIGRTKEANGKGKFLRYAEGHYPDGNSEFEAATFEELVEHCRKEHGYDLRALLKSNDVDAEKVDSGKVEGEKVYRAGLFTNVKAIGWYVDAYERAQLSINFTNYKVTPPWVVLEKVREMTAARGVVVTGSEVVGVIPFQAMLEAGHWYLERQGKTPGVPVMDAVKTAMYSMGLKDAAPFEIEHKVLGLPQHDQLVSMTVTDFADEVSRDTPAPGGGSIAALAGALGASLASMVAALTQGSKYSTPDTEATLSETAVKAQEIKDKLVRGVDADTNAFNAFVDARRLPQGTDEEKKVRAEAILAGIKAAIDVPWETAVQSLEAMKVADVVARIGNPNSITDGAVGVECGFAGVRGGLWNVMVNLKDVEGDPAYVTEMKDKCAALLAEAQELLASTTEYVDAALLKSIEG